MSMGLDRLRDVLDEARSFLSMPRGSPLPARRTQQPAAPIGSPESARRLFAMARPIFGTIAEAYLRKRGITALHETTALRFHARCYYRPHADAPTEAWPALIAAVTDLAGRITGAHRTWLDRSGNDKAPVDTPRRAMGQLLGHGVRFAIVTDVTAAGEGIETMLALRSVLAHLPSVAALSAAHLGALHLPEGLKRLYIACDNDRAGLDAGLALAARAISQGIAARLLVPDGKDFNDDLKSFGIASLVQRLRPHLWRDDQEH